MGVVGRYLHHDICLSGLIPVYRSDCKWLSPGFLHPLDVNPHKCVCVCNAVCMRFHEDGAYVPMCMHVKHFEPGWCWGKVLYECAVLLLDQYPQD